MTSPLTCGIIDLSKGKETIKSMTTIGPFASYYKARTYFIEYLTTLESPTTAIKIYKKRDIPEWYIEHNNPNKEFCKLVKEEGN